MADQAPVKLQQILDLSQQGVPADKIGFLTLTISSEKYITLRDADTVSIYDTSSPTAPIKRPIKADSALMHPTQSILALKAGNLLQVYRLQGAQQERVAMHTMPENVEFWRWLTPSVLALVTASAVYHWNIEQNTPPTLAFQRLPQLAGHQIVNYHANHDLTWLCLVGLVKAGDRIVGHAQLFSVEKNVSQPLDACAVNFGTRIVPGQPKPVTVFAFAARPSLQQSTLNVMDVDGTHARAKAQQPIYYPDDTPQDFPLAIEVSSKYGVVFLLTKEGKHHLYDAETAARISLNQVSIDPFFAACAHTSTGGIMAVNKRGQVMAISVNEATLVPYVANTLNNVAMAVSLAVRGNLPGAESLFQRQFQQLIASGQHAAAARVAAEAPKGILRTPATLALLKSLPPTPQGAVVHQYLSALLEKPGVQLNEAETQEVAGPLIAQGRKEHLQQFVRDDKLHNSESLGDALRALDVQLAVTVYERAKAHHKVVGVLAELGLFDKLVAYAKRESYTPNWMQLLQSVLARNPAAGVTLAKMLLTAEGGALLDPNAAIDAFVARGMIKELMMVMLDGVVKPQSPSDAPLQTRLLEVTLKYNPKVADTILMQKMFAHFDRQRIAVLAEEAGLHQRALELYDSLSEIKRLLKSPSVVLDAAFLVPFCGRLSARDTLECLRVLLNANFAQNLDAVVAVGVRYTPPPPAPGAEPPSGEEEQLQPQQIISLFEEHKSYQGTYLYLKQIIALHGKSNRDLVFKFIEAAAKVGAVQDVEGACRLYEYDAAAVRELLKEVQLSDQLPLIIVCDKHGFVDDLTRYLWRNKLFDFIETYLRSINPANTPVVVGALLDENADEDKIKHLVHAVAHMCPLERLVEEVEKRQRLKLLRPWLEQRYNEGSRDPAVHNALAKILIITNDERKEQFLATNQFYDARVVGKFCETSEPDLAVQAYKRGGLHAELVAVTTRHGMFKQQARYLVELQSPELWAQVLREDTPARRALIDQLVQTVLPETKRPELVSTTVKAFIDADLPGELIVLLERIVLDSNNPDFAKNRNLQNLLLMNAIKSAKGKVLEYAAKLTDYDAPTLAHHAATEGLYEEAFAMYKKAKLHVEALSVLVDHLHALERAQEFAEKVNEPAVYAKLGRAWLQHNKPAEAITAFLKADDAESYFQVITAAKEAGLHEALAKFLRMARKLKKEKIDTELALALARTNKLSELEELIRQPNLAKLQEVGELAASEGLYEAARLCFAAGSNHARLASTLLRLKQYTQAVEAARVASSLAVWKEVNKACLEAGEARLAQVAGQHIIVHGEELDEVVALYEARGKSDELMALLESALGNERAHQGMFTVLAQLYSNYRPEKLMEHLKLFVARLNIGKVCGTVKANAQWRELAFLYQHDNEVDKALQVMMEHSEDAWDDLVFKETVQRAVNPDVLYDAVAFYLAHKAPLVNELLHVLRDKLDHVRLVERVRKLGHLPLIKPYLVSVQEKNVQAVNDALNELYMEEEDFAALKTSLDTYDNVDALELAQRLEKAERLELRRIAAHLYAKNKRWRQSVEISKKDGLDQDAMKTAAESRDRELAEELLRYFVEQGSAHSFAAALLVCYDLLRPDVVLELAWKAKWTDYAFPYLIQVMREYTTKIDQLVAATRPPVDAEGRPLPVPPPGFVMPPPGAVPVPMPMAPVPLPVPMAGPVPVPAPIPGGLAPPPYAMPPSTAPGAVPAPVPVPGPVPSPVPPRAGGFDPNDFSGLM